MTEISNFKTFYKFVCKTDEEMRKPTLCSFTHFCLNFVLARAILFASTTRRVSFWVTIPKSTNRAVANNAPSRLEITLLKNK